MGSGYYWEGDGKPVGWSKVQESGTFPTSECCSCLNAELTHTNWVKKQGRNREEDKGGQMEGTGAAQRVSFAIGWGVSLLDLSKTKQNKTKKTQIPCQTKNAIALSLGLQALFLKSNEHYLTPSHCWGHPDPMTPGVPDVLCSTAVFQLSSS